MKRYIYLVFIGLATFIFASCEGPAGPAGIDGMDGQDGEDLTSSTCLNCHGDAMDAIRNQFATSNHYAAEISTERVEEGGWSASCSRCHSSEGFIAYAAGADVGAVPVPGKWECKTCHSIHATFEATDYAFRLADPVTLSGTEVDGGNNNTCLNCHQARRERDAYDGTEDKTYTRTFTGDDIAVYTTAAVGPGGTQGVLNGTMDTLTVVFDVPVATHVYINSTHAGPHHGPQGNLWAGLGGTLEGTPYSSHDGGCVTCHMGEASGHSFNPELDNCIDCHGSKETEMDNFADRVEAVALALEAIHAVHIDSEWESGDQLWGMVHPMYASLTTAQFDAFWNFIYIVEDRSKSAHNPTYMKALLAQCEDALGL